MKKKICINCNYCTQSGEDLVCVNGESEYTPDFVEPDHTCDDGEWSEEECE